MAIALRSTSVITTKSSCASSDATAPRAWAHPWRGHQLEDPEAVCAGSSGKGGPSLSATCQTPARQPRPVNGGAGGASLPSEAASPRRIRPCRVIRQKAQAIICLKHCQQQRGIVASQVTGLPDATGEMAADSISRHLCIVTGNCRNSACIFRCSSELFSDLMASAISGRWRSAVERTREYDIARAAAFRMDGCPSERQPPEATEAEPRVAVVRNRYTHSIVAAFEPRRRDPPASTRPDQAAAGSLIRPSSPTWSNFTATRLLTPCSCIVTPYSTSAICIVRLECVMMMNWLCSRNSWTIRLKRWLFASSSAASTSSRMQNGLGLLLKIAHQQRDAGHRLLAAGELADRDRLLARRAGDDLDAGVEDVDLLLAGSG